MRKNRYQGTYDPNEGRGVTGMPLMVCLSVAVVLVCWYLYPVVKEIFTPPEPNALVYYPDGSVHREFVYHRTFVLEQEGLKCIQVGRALSCSPLKSH